MHPMDDNLVGYLLNALDDDARRGVEGYLRIHPEARLKLARLRERLAPLAADRDTIEPPPGLARATLARVRQAKTLPAAPCLRAAAVGGRSWWRRTDVLAAAASLLLAIGIGAAWLVSAWQRSDIVACQENLHRFHGALVAYSEMRPDGAFPRVEAEGPRAAAGIFVPLLADGGVLGEDVSVSCPARGRRPALREPGQVRQLEELYTADRAGYIRAVRDMAGCYAYSLGYRDAGGLHGLRRGAGDLLPIMADCPPFHDAAAGEGNSLNHGGGGQNVLTIGGSVRYCTSRGVGVEGDDIYLNREQRVLAGLYPTDTVLAVSDAVP
jgi:hypothetical protein